MPPLWDRQALLGPEHPHDGQEPMQRLVQDGLPSYSWEELHFLLWLKLSRGFFLFVFVLFWGTPKTEAGGAVGKDG